MDERTMTEAEHLDLALAEMTEDERVDLALAELQRIFPDRGLALIVVPFDQGVGRTDFACNIEPTMVATLLRNVAGRIERGAERYD